MLELWGVRSTHLLSSHPGSLRPGLLSPDRVLSIGQIELFDIKTMYLCKTELFEIELFEYLTV